MAGGGIGALPMQVATDNKLYCVDQSPHDDVSDMIGCDEPDCLNVSTTPLRYWVFWQCLPFSWTTLRGKHCRQPHCRNGSCKYVRTLLDPIKHLDFARALF
jgi:hypothetical protein